MKPDKTKKEKKLTLERLTITQLKGAVGGCEGMTRFTGCTGCNDASHFSCRASCL